MITKQFIDQAVQKYKSLSPIYYHIEYQNEDNEIWETAVRLTDKTVEQSEDKFVEVLHQLEQDNTVELVKIQFYPNRKGYLDMKATLTNFEQPKSYPLPPIEEQKFPQIPTPMPQTQRLSGLGEIRESLIKEFELKEAQKKVAELEKQVAVYKQELTKMIDENEKYEDEILGYLEKIREIENDKDDKTKEMIFGFLGKAGEKIFGGENTSSLQGLLPEDNNPRSIKIREINQMLQYFNEDALQQFHQQLATIISQQEPQTV